VRRPIKLAVIALVFQMLSAVTSVAQVPAGSSPPRKDPVTVPKPDRAVAVRGLITVGGGLLPGSRFTDSEVRRLNAEDANFGANYSVEGGTGLSVSVSLNVWRGLGIKVGTSRYASQSGAQITGSVPHPFFFNRPRTFDGNAAGLDRQESAIDMHIGGTLSVGRRVTVAFGAGPSMLRVKQAIVNDLRYSDSYPHDSISFMSATAANASGSKLVLGGGVQLGLFLTRTLGVAAGAQLATGNVPIRSEGSDERIIKVGGAKVNVGLAVRF
jgi:hypothetical protein